MICPQDVGYSGHERGISIAIAAVALGAKIIEKHFTIDRSMEGNDHKVSLLPDEFKMMVAEIRNVEASLGKKIVSVLFHKVSFLIGRLWQKHSC